MIKQVDVLSYAKLRALAPCLNMDECVFISILDPGMVNSVFPLDTTTILREFFWDWDPTSAINLVSLDGEPANAYFTIEKAQKILDFLKKWKDAPGEQTLLVNCVVGISRSGAVASFATTFLGLDYDDFKRRNSWISPNAYVLKQLNSLLWGEHFAN